MFDKTPVRHINVMVLAAGKSTRMKSEVPKPFMTLNNMDLYKHCINSMRRTTTYGGDDNVRVKYHLVTTEQCLKSANVLVGSLDYVCGLIDVSTIILREETSSPVESALRASWRLGESATTGLIIADCDQILRWSFRDFIRTSKGYAGYLSTYTPPNLPSHNSYVRLDAEGLVCEVREKSVISNVSPTGVYYFRNREMFATAAGLMMVSNDTVNGEYYMAPLYNYLPKGYPVGVFHVPNELHIPCGTPEDFAKAATILSTV